MHLVDLPRLELSGKDIVSPGLGLGFFFITPPNSCSANRLRWLE
jgi:hypothetical protein